MNEELFEKYYFGTLDQAESDRLKNLLEYNTAVRSEFALYSMERAMFVRSAGKLAGLSGTFGKQDIFAQPVSENRWTGNVARKLAAIAATLLVIGGISVALYYQRYPTVARLDSVTGDVYVTYETNTLKAEVGQRLISRMQIEVRGNQSQAIIFLKDKSRIRFPGDGKMAITELAGRKELHLLAGMFEADFQKQPAGKPLWIITPQSRSEVLGTSLQIRTTPTATRLEVVEGHVRIMRGLDGRSSDVMTRYAVSVGKREDNMAVERFFWADRFSGGEGGVCGTMRTSLFDEELRRLDEQHKRAEMRFKDSGGR